MIGLTTALLFVSVAGPPALEWRAPAGCPTADAVLASIAALNDHADIERVRARGVIRQVRGRYSLRLEVHTERLTLKRTVDADTCDTLADAAALLIAIAVDPVEVATQIAADQAAPAPRDLAPEAVREVIVPPVVVPPPAAAEARAPLTVTPPTSTPAPAPAKPRTSVFVRLEGAVEAGASQTTTGDTGGAFGVLHRWLRFEVHGVYTPARPLELDHMRVGMLARWAVGTRICGRLMPGTLEVPLCLGAEGGQFRATGAGITVSAREPRPPWFAVLVGLGFVWSPHPRIGLGARTEFVISPWQAQFYVSDQPVFFTQPLGVRFGLGLEIRFGPGARGDGTPQTRP